MQRKNKFKIKVLNRTCVLVLCLSLISRRVSGPLMANRHIDNKTLMTWSSSVIQRVAQQRYLSAGPDTVKTHRHLANLFLQTWLKGTCTL